MSSSDRLITGSIPFPGASRSTIHYVGVLLFPWNSAGGANEVGLLMFVQDGLVWSLFGPTDGSG